jgi:GNAT superfamily N-acetyltransferase
MADANTNSQQVSFHPLTADRWGDLETLFGPRGATGGCWCMWWRMKRSEFERQKGAGNRQAFKELVASGQTTGILAYLKTSDGEIPVGWCAVAPRRDFSALERSRILKRVDDQPVWSVTCFFVSRKHRRHGLTKDLLRAAVDYAAQNGAKIVEGYPVEPKKDKVADVFVYTGLASAFLEAGFVEVLRRSETRPIMRFMIDKNQP